MHEGPRGLSDQPDDEEELSVLPLPEMSPGRDEAELDPFGRGKSPKVSRPGQGGKDQAGAPAGLGRGGGEVRGGGDGV